MFFLSIKIYTAAAVAHKKNFRKVAPITPFTKRCGLSLCAVRCERKKVNKVILHSTRVPIITTLAVSNMLVDAMKYSVSNSITVTEIKIDKNLLTILVPF